MGKCSGSENLKIIMFYVYILESMKNSEFYTGFTNDLKRRVEEHNNKLNVSTKHGVPWKVIYYEACVNKDDAERREKYLKTSQGRRLMKRRLKEYFFNNK
jgi:putative endonuclease